MRLPSFVRPALAGLLLCLSPAYGAPADHPLARLPTLPQDLLHVAHDLSQSGLGEFDALQTRTFLETRFIPNGISVYSFREPGRTEIVIEVAYRHAGAIATPEAARQACEGMVRWVRFHLGVKDDGQALIEHASEFGSSTLYRWVEPGKGARMEPAVATALDAATIVRGLVLPLDPEGEYVSCTQPLVAAGAEARLDF